MQRPSDLAPQSYLVLGGNGFVGSHLVRALIARGEKRVAVMSRSKPKESKLIHGAQYYTGDIGDKARLVEVMREVGSVILASCPSLSAKADP